jgi:hypothetical protein
MIKSILRWIISRNAGRNAQLMMMQHLLVALQAYIHNDDELVKVHMNNAAVWYRDWVLLETKQTEK